MKERPAKRNLLSRTIRRPQNLTGTVSVPGDKSISHRAIMFNAIANGISKISGLSMGTDLLSTVNCLRSLGVVINLQPELSMARVVGVSGRLKKSDIVLDASNSATTMRLLAGILAAQDFESVLSGDSSLLSRPMDRIIEPLKLMGAVIDGTNNDTFPPIVIQGSPLNGIDYTLPIPSAQLKTCLLLAGLYAEGQTTLRQTGFSRDHSERMLVDMGAELQHSRQTLNISPSRLTSIDVKVPGDISAATFWMVAGICHPDARIKIVNVGVNPTRTGAIGVLKSMGACIYYQSERMEGSEEVADLVIESSSLEGTEISGDIIPNIIDEIPALAVAACFANGTTTFKNAEELRYKESDRISKTVKELSSLGASIEELSDGMIIQGTAGLKGGVCEAHGDHRLAMALGVAGILSDSETVVFDDQVVEVSYPDFWTQVELICKD